MISQAWLILEVVTRLMRVGPLLHFMSLIHVLNAASAVYVAFISNGILNYTFVLVFHAPYLIALARTYLDIDSERRRLILYNVCKAMYFIQLSVDFWATCNIQPDVAVECQGYLETHSGDILSEQEEYMHPLRWNRVRLQYCMSRFWLSKFWTGCLCYHAYLIFHVVVARRFWK